jgi:hypothetical protein
MPDDQTHQPQGASHPGLDDALDRFWSIGSEAAEMVIRISAPDIEGEILKVLGEPDFDQAIAEQLPEVYARVSKRALAVAFGEARAAGPDEPRVNLKPL